MSQTPSAHFPVSGSGSSCPSGRGIGVAVLDTGCFPHEDYSRRIAAFFDMVRRRRLPYDDNGHGTHVCGIIGGDGSASGGRFCGVAPGCHLIPVKVLDKRGGGYVSDVLSGLHTVLQHRDRYNIRIVNVSVGSFSGRNMSENSALVRGVEEIWDAAGEFVNDNTLTVYIKRLREKIETDPQNPTIIRTVRGLGYKLE